MKNDIKGITLISLIITIILLLILAGVALNFAIGENGIFKLATDASNNYMNEQQKELQNLEKLYSQIKVATNDGSQITISIEDLNKIIDNKVKQNSGILLWSNNNPSSAFAPQTITLSEPLSNFKYIKILFSDVYNSQSTEAIITNNKVHSTLFYSTYLKGWSGHPLWYRSFTGENNTITFNTGYSSGSGENNTANNNLCIPHYIIGYNF